MSLCSSPGMSPRPKADPLQGAHPDHRSHSDLQHIRLSIPTVLTTSLSTALQLQEQGSAASRDSLPWPSSSEQGWKGWGFWSCWLPGSHCSHSGRPDIFSELGKGYPSGMMLGRKTQPALVSNPSSAQKSCATLDKSLHPSEAQFLYL